MEKLRQYSHFNSVKEMDQVVNQALSTFELKENERSVLFTLSQYSCKFIGVSYLKTDSLSDLLGVSRRTIQRALKRLSELGIIRRMKQYRKVSGGYGASITIILPLECHIALSPCEGVTEQATEGAQELFNENDTFISKANNQELIKERKQNELDHTYLTNSIIPVSFINAVKPFFSSAKEIYSLWGKVLLASSKYAPDVQELTEVGVSAFKQTVFASKMGKIKKSFRGYLWGALAHMLSVMQRKVVFKRNNLFYDWLEDN
jgi:predicted transcriptional regulator